MAKILIVDDDLSLCKILSKLLEGAGHRIFLAHDGNPALEIAHDEKPDLVITDILMPDMEGIALIATLKSRFPDLKVIAMSGGGEDTTGGEYLESAHKVFNIPTIEKPLDNDQILKMVKTSLSNA